MSQEPERELRPFVVFLLNTLLGWYTNRSNAWLEKAMQDAHAWSVKERAKFDYKFKKETDFHEPLN